MGRQKIEDIRKQAASLASRLYRARRGGPLLEVEVDYCFSMALQLETSLGALFSESEPSGQAVACVHVSEDEIELEQLAELRDGQLLYAQPTQASPGQAEALEALECLREMAYDAVSGGADRSTVNECALDLEKYLTSTARAVPDEWRHTLECAVENMRSADKSDRTREARFELASAISHMLATPKPEEQA